MDSAQVLLALRLGLVAILYLVILQIVGVSRREMKRAARMPAAASARAGTTVVGHLIVIDSGGTSLTPGARLDVEPVTTIGRAPTNTVVIESNFVSTEHTRILYRDRSLWVEDMGSRNGTFVDAKPVTQPAAVVPGSVLQVGDVRFKFAV